jgi:hypothetical protein
MFAFLTFRLVYCVSIFQEFSSIFCFHPFQFYDLPRSVHLTFRIPTVSFVWSLDLPDTCILTFYFNQFYRKCSTFYCLPLQISFYLFIYIFSYLFLPSLLPFLLPDYVIVWRVTFKIIYIKIFILKWLQQPQNMDWQYSRATD